MQYLVTATALKNTDDGRFATVEIPRFLLDSEIEGVTEYDAHYKAREIMGHLEYVKISIREYHPRRKV